jgi:hypothetical protein
MEQNQQQPDHKWCFNGMLIMELQEGFIILKWLDLGLEISVLNSI